VGIPLQNKEDLMGLDMYLYGDLYLSEYGTKEEKERRARVLEALSDLKEFVTNDAGIRMEIPLGYWRKANAIHAWFVNQCGGGVDECQRIPVPREKIEELKKICEEILAKKDNIKEEEVERLLPPQSGFFFGNTEINEYYFEDLEQTVNILDRALKSPYEEFVYRASW
jgi:hypothetical protein